MQVVCETVGDFIEHIEDGKIWQSTIFINRTRKPVGGDKFNAVKWEVCLQASAVVQIDEESQLLLQYGEFCGYDYTDASAESKATERADGLLGQLRCVCEDKGLKIKPGILGM